MIDVAIFDPAGAPLVAKVVYKNGVIAAAYNLTLSEKNSNTVITDYDGNNLNPEDDSYSLPDPVATNDGRLIILSNKFYGLDLENSKEYEIALEVYQGGELLSHNVSSGSITGQTQDTIQFTKLVKQP